MSSRTLFHYLEGALQFVPGCIAEPLVNWAILIAFFEFAGEEAVADRISLMVVGVWGAPHEEGPCASNGRGRGQTVSGRTCPGCPHKKPCYYVETHEHAVTQKANIMTDHFLDEGIRKGKVGGKACAMFVTKSREMSIRYFWAISSYLRETGAK